MPTKLSCASGRRIGLLTALVVSLVAVVAPAYSALPSTLEPTLKLNHTIRTTPFAGSSVSMKDNEGSAYVPRDNSLWLADDNGRAIYEVNASTGALKQSIDRTDLADVRRLDGGAAAGANRVRDLESLAYDAATDTLYLFSGSCCTATVLPTVFRLTRQSGTLQLDSYQPLPTGSDHTAAAWNPRDGKVYVALNSNIRSYTYSSNTLGSTFQISNLSGILGMTFSSDGADLFVARSATRLSRVNWATKSLVSGWTFDLSRFGMLDTRAVELINDQFWVSDGYDSRAAGDPFRDAVFVFDVLGSSSDPTPPPPPPGDNLIANAGFETDTTGWDTNGFAAVSLTRVAGGHSGSWSAKLTNTGTASVTNTLNDAPNRAATSKAGTYTGSLWVRSDKAGAKLTLRVREFKGSTKVSEKLVVIVLSTTWQKVTASLVPVTPGATSIDFSAAIYSAPAGSTFYADDASLTFS